MAGDPWDCEKIETAMAALRQSEYPGRDAQNKLLIVPWKSFGPKVEKLLLNHRRAGVKGEDTGCGDATVKKTEQLFCSFRCRRLRRSSFGCCSTRQHMRLVANKLRQSHACFRTAREGGAGNRSFARLACDRKNTVL